MGCATSFRMFFLRRDLGQVVRRRVVGRYASVGRPADRSVAIGQTFGMDVGARPPPRARPQADLRIADVIPRHCRCSAVAGLLYWVKKKRVVAGPEPECASKESLSLSSSERPQADFPGVW